MPSPGILEMFTSSISSLHRSVHHLINNVSKTDVEISSYLASIQSLRGLTPGEKYRDLNEIIQVLAQTRNDRGELISTEEFREISPAMTPLVRAMVGVKLKMGNLIVEALQSEDASVQRKVLKANWQFDGLTPSPEEFMKRVVPTVSVCTRGRIVKKLSKSLLNRQSDAEKFFRAFVELYGVEQSMPLLLVCSEPFIFEAILKHKILLPVHVVQQLYSRYPQLVVRYLQLGNKNNPSNFKDREQHEIRINDYDAFLPALIWNHCQDFVELFRLTPEKDMKLSARKSAFFLKNSRNAVVEEPQVFLKLLPLKLVAKEFDQKTFDKMYENLFSANIEEFKLNDMIDYLEYYTYGDKLEILKDTYEKRYGKRLLENESHLKSKKLIKILSKEKRMKKVKSVLFKNETDDLYICYLPPSESLPILKEKISKASAMEERIQILGDMITSCNIYDSKEDLLDVLQYFYDKHKNEQNLFLCCFFEKLKSEITFKALDPRHWVLLRQIISYSYLKKELFKSHVQLIESVLEAALAAHHDINPVYVDKLVDMIVEFNMEYRKAPFKWNYLKDQPTLERGYICRFFELIPTKYPTKHAIWKEKKDRLVYVLSFMKSIADYNKRNGGSKKKGKPLKDDTNLPVDNWILELSQEFFSKSDNEAAFKNRKAILLELIKKCAPKFYESKVDEYSTIRDIEKGEALALLKRHPERVLANWPDYLAEAKERLHNGSKAARRFVAATKWYHELPIKFVERCLIDLKEEGSILVLGILLEGSAFENVVSPYLPTDGKLDIEDTDAKESFELRRSILKAMNWTNPPVSFDFIASFCHGDYVALAEATLASRTHHAPVVKVLEFTRKLVDKQAAVKKRGIRMIQKVATKAQLMQFLDILWASEMNWPLRNIVSKMALDTFIEVPNSDNWDLVKKCMAGLTVDDKTTILRFADIANVDFGFLGRYVKMYLTIIHELSEKGLDYRTRTNAVCTVIQILDEKLMHFIPEDVSRTIVERYFFDVDSLEISRVTQNFTISIYLLSSDSIKFEGRLETVINILMKVIETFDVPHPKKRRFYPANYTINEFFRDVLQEMSAGKGSCGLMIIDSLLKVFPSKLYPWQEPYSYLALSLYKEYLLSASPQEFGVRCAKRCSDLVEDFSANEAVINDIAKCLNDFIASKIFRTMKQVDIKLNVIEGLLKEESFYGSLLCTKLLNSQEINDFDERYDALIKALKKKRNEAIQYNLYKHLNTIQYN